MSYRVFHKNIDEKISEKLTEVEKSTAELDEFGKQIQNLTIDLNNVENYIEQMLEKPLILDLDSLKVQENQLNQIKTELGAINSEHLKLNDKHKSLVSKGIISWNDELKKQLNTLNKRNIKFDNKVIIYDRDLVHTTVTLGAIQERTGKIHSNIISIKAEIEQAKPISTSIPTENLIADYKQYERNYIEPLKDEIKSLKQEYQHLLSGVKCLSRKTTTGK
jgi:hypothetical protein